MSYGPGASLGGGLQVCAIGQLCWLSDSSDPFSPPEGCSNSSPGDGGPGDSGPGGGQACSGNPSGGDSTGGPDVGNSNGNGNGGSPQYQLFNSVILPYRPRHRKPIHYVLHGLGENVSCAPPPGTAPPLVTGPGAAFQESVATVVSGVGGACGLDITCLETGVTLTFNGHGSVFYHDAQGTTHYSTPGGSGFDCRTLIGHTYSSGSAQGNGASLGVDILVTIP